MTQIKKKILMLIDGSNYLYRAYYVFPSLINNYGESIGAIYGVLNMLNSLSKRYYFDELIIIFDTKYKNFRNNLFKEYKANRKPMPINLQKQIIPLFKIIKAMGIPVLSVKGVEADDVIGTLAVKAVQNGNNVLISTSDKDMAQLVSCNINIIDNISNTILGPKEIVFKFGVSPELIIDYLALVGDNIDNIPGVPGIGSKTAQILLQKIGGLNILYKQLNNVSKLKFRGNKNIANQLNKHRDTAFLSYNLAKIKTDVRLNFTYDQLKIKKLIFNDIIVLFKRYGIMNWLNTLNLK